MLSPLFAFLQLLLSFLTGPAGYPGLQGRDGEPGAAGFKGEQGDMGIPGKIYYL